MDIKQTTVAPHRDRNFPLSSVCSPTNGGCSLVNRGAAPLAPDPRWFITVPPAESRGAEIRAWSAGHGWPCQTRSEANAAKALSVLITGHPKLS